MTDARPDPDQLLAEVKAQEAPRRARPPADLLRRLGRRRQDLRDAARQRARCATKARTSSSASSRRTAARRPRRCSQGLEVLPPRDDRRTRAARSREFDLDAALARQPGADPGRRARAHQRAGLAPSEALAGHRRAAGRRHRRLHDAQRPAPREPERRRRRHHRHHASGRRCPTRSSTTPTR